MDISVVLCTHNPRADYLASTLASLAQQADIAEGIDLEFILVDNSSREPLDQSILPSGINNSRIVCEPQLGLTHARLRSFQEAKGRIILFIDDDNALRPNYLKSVLMAFESDPRLGAIGGKVLPRYEVPPPDWFAQTGISLACRNLGDVPLYAEWRAQDTVRSYPVCAPIGAGMAIRRKAYEAYVEGAHDNPARLALGRRGADLASGEDNDMILTLLDNGWRVAYLPQLVLDHLIPAQRLTQEYLENYAFSSNRTWVQVLAVHGLCPWRPLTRWTLPIRKARSWFLQRAWRGPVERIAWRSACGLFEGRASLIGLDRS
ncbi:glycosyltransferase [Porphyrobacter sp. SLTP]|uniref:glycosyltransferase n=1 Tax=Porphyrobacter sp. SLTP TaxID=2683266 RepID=UPI001412BB5C|nr:glycosyltransferase [Porphyrobacter sp. SLTP]NBB23594.1 glycosyltransferase [Porphyrobacter sp. SLTP]